MKTLDQILEGTTEQPEEREAVAPPVEGTDPDGAEAAAPRAVEGADPEPAAMDGADRMVPVSALIDERRKRRAAEERLARRGHGEAEAGTPGRQGGARFRDDPEGYVNALKAEMAAQIATVRVDAAENAARGRYRDYDAKVRAFARAAAADPGLVAAMRAAADPAEFAYRLGARVLGAAAMPGQAPAAPAATPRPPLPESLSGSPSAEGPPAGGWRPKPLSEIVGGR